METVPAQPEVVSRVRLTSSAGTWQYDREMNSRTGDVHIAWLRQKLDNPRAAGATSFPLIPQFPLGELFHPPACL